MVYHLVGVKGSGMSALAQILHDMGHSVQGSDVAEHFFTQEPLEQRKIPLLPFNRHHIKKGQTIIASSAYPDHHEEILRAHELHLPVYRYHQFLGSFIQQFTSIAVTGSHGKTSTTGLLAHVLEKEVPTSYLIGDGSGKGEVNSRYFVFEACEYQRHFLAYHPDYCIMTNIDFDHPDYFRDIDDVSKAFSEMAEKVQKRLIVCGDDTRLRRLKAPVPMTFYGQEDGNEVQAKNTVFRLGGTSFDVMIDGSYFDTFTIPRYGYHNVLNALAVVALCHHKGISKDTVKSRIRSFSGVQRRFTETRLGDQVLIDDYAHHPSEIRATIEACRQKYPKREIVAIFQPHTFTRTKAFLGDFAKSLQQADRVYLCDIFSSARENSGDLTIEDLRRRIPGAKRITEDDIGLLSTHPSSALLFMGAGDVNRFQKAYEDRVASTSNSF